MMAPIIARYSFHPVGQGLFASGHLQLATDELPLFRWVNDCGTSSTQRLLKNALWQLSARAKRSQRRKPRIDLVAISHFDRDHISGLAALLGEFSVGTLLLPYIPIWQRLIIAFEEGIDTRQDYMEFFINPASYIAAIEGADIESIIFVPPSGREGPPDEGGGESGPPPEHGSRAPLILDEGQAPETDAQRDIESFYEQNVGGPAVGFLRAGGRCYIAGRWEFVPYNDASLAPKVSPKFVRNVRGLRDQLLLSSSEEKRGKALKHIKEEYDGTFGKTAEKRNVISLFLYAGPFQTEDLRVGECHFVCQGAFTHIHSLRRDGIAKPSILYTGDGYLDTPARAKKLMNYLGPDTRLKRLCVLQVMHHGAEGNWHAGIAARLGSEVSVFSSDPIHKKFGHPHAAVLRDFLLHSPIQVDKVRGAVIEVVLDFR